MKKVFAVLFFGAAITAAAFAQAPASIGGLTWRGEFNYSAKAEGFHAYMYAIDFRSDGTYVPRFGLSWHDSGFSPSTESYLTLNPGTYTYQVLSSTDAQVTLVSSNGGGVFPDVIPLSFTTPTQGVGYAGSPFSLTSTGGTGPARSLINMSTLISARQGSPVVFGFVIGGTTPWREILVRAVGPSLSQFGITNFAPNPTYSISPIALYPFNQITNMSLPGASAQNWSAGLAGPTIIAENKRAGAFDLLAGSNDKADVVLLAPGSYTITINPTDSSGEGAELVEIYEVQ